jgi:hypothetical protein
LFNILHYAFAGVVVILIVASIVTATLIRIHPEKNYVNVKLRIQTWWWLVGVLFFALIFSRTIAVIVMALVSFMAFKEFLSIAPTRRADPARRSCGAVAGVSGDSSAIPVGRHGMVRHVHHLHPGVCIFAAADAHGGDWGNARLSARRRNHSMGLDDDGF